MKRMIHRWLALMLLIAGGVQDLPKRVYGVANKGHRGLMQIEGVWHIQTKYGLRAVPAGAAGGETDTTALADSIPTVLAGARLVREQIGQNFASSVDRVPLPMGTGSSWREVDLSKINAQAVPEGQSLDNPQRLSDTLLSIEPTRVGVHVIVTSQLMHYVDGSTKRWGELMQNAIERKKDRDGLNKYDGATVTGGGAGTTLNSGIVSAMVAQIQSDTDESAMETEEIFFYHHGFQMHDVRTELTSGVGTYVLTPGMTQDAFARGAGVVREVGGAVARPDNNIRIDSNTDAHGGVHARSGLVLVEVTGKQRAFTERLSNRGGDEALWLWDWYGYGERSAGNLVKRILTDATAPTTG